MKFSCVSSISPCTVKQVGKSPLVIAVKLNVLSMSTDVCVHYSGH